MRVDADAPVRSALRMISMLKHLQYLLVFSVCIAGCASTAEQKTDRVAQPTIVTSERPLATWGSTRITSSELEPMLLEMNGEVLLREYVLSLELEREAVRRKITLDAEALIRERELLAESMADESNQAERLLMQIREDRGLGPGRFSYIVSA